MMHAPFNRVKTVVTMDSEEGGRFLLELYRRAASLPDKELYQYFLDHAVNVTKSTIGFFHFVSKDQQAIILTTWNKEALKNCRANYANHYPVELAGNWADCLRLKQPIIYNDFKQSPNRKGLPEGHVRINRLLSFPLMEDGKVEAIFGVGNKAESYAKDDVMQLDLIANELSKILKQRRTERELQEANAKYSTLFANMLDGFAYCEMIFDEQQKPIDFVHLEVNNAFERSTGLKKDTVLNKRVTEAIPDIKKVLPELLEIYGRVAITEKEERFEIFFEPSSIWLAISAYSPKKGYFAAVFENITERKKAEEALIQSEKKYRRLYETSMDGIIARDLQGNMIDCNQEYARMLGYTKEDLARLGWQQVLPGKWHQQREEITKEIIESGGSVVFEREYQRKSGEIFPASVRTWRLTSDKGKTIGTWSIVRDITEQKALQRRLEEHSENLERIVKERTDQLRDSERMAAIGSTAGMVGHDIRNPLQAIMSDIFLVKSDLSVVPQGEEKDGMKESLESMEKNVDYINKIVQDLQDYARPLRPKTEETYLDKLCEEVTLNTEIPHNIKASCQIEEDAKKIFADPALLKRILANLVNNAVQAMPEGGNLDLCGYRDADNVVVTVRDTGAGIPEEVRPKLFTPLFTTKSKGQGFGLAVVKRMTEALGGTVTFESEIGKGTTFIIRLPPKK